MCTQGARELCTQRTRELCLHHTKIAPREECADLGAQNSWCTELLVHTTIPPTFRKNNKHRGAERPCGAHRRRALVVFAKCWWNSGVHQELCAPRSVLSSLGKNLVWCCHSSHLPCAHNSHLPCVHNSHLSCFHNSHLPTLWSIWGRLGGTFSGFLPTFSDFVWGCS